MERHRVSRRTFAGAAALALAGCRKDGARGVVVEEGHPTVPPSPRPGPRDVPKRALGKTGVSVSIVGLGGYHIGSVNDESEAVRIIHAALDRGVTFLDNCWDYHEGRSEEWMGKALADGHRRRAFLMTKLDGRNAKAASEQLEQSLRRLRTDMIDLVQIHEVIRMEDPRRSFAAGGVVEALLAAKSAGKLRFIGFTGHKDPSIHLAMLNAADEHGVHFDTVQMPLNVMDAHYRSFEKLVLPVLQQKGIGVLGMKPLAAGKILETKLVSATECLHYAMNLPTSTVITGCDSMPVLEQAIDAALSFSPMNEAQVSALLARTREAAQDGRYERFKSSHDHDGTIAHPEWLDSATI